MISDEELYRQYLSGDETGLEELMKKYFDNSPVKLFTSVVNLADKQELKKMKKIIKNTANL